MAHSLSSQFLTEDEKSFINKLFTSSQNDTVSTTLFPYDTVSINELTRQMTHSSLYNNNNTFKSQHPKCVFENGSFAKSSTRNDTVLKQNLQRARYDLLHADAGEVQRMIHQVNNKEEEAFYGFTPKKPLGFHSQNHQQALSQKQLQLQIAQFEMLKKQWMKQREEFVRAILQRRSGNYQNTLGGRRNNETVFEGNVGLSSSAWSSVKSGSNNNKAGFYGNPNLKNERNGTGVFLPRVVDATESRKKQVSKNVVVPERVVHALNRKVEEGMIRGYMEQKNRFYGTSNFENGVGRIGSDDGFSQQIRNVKVHTEVNREIRLPQEWTY